LKIEPDYPYARSNLAKAQALRKSNPVRN
jgi:hypothetical protein